MQCPSCNSSMTAQFYEGVEIDKCSSCQGVWLDHAEIQTIVKTKEESFDEKDKISAIENKGADLGDGGQRTCPKCQKSLEKMQYAVTSGVIIDRCPDRHGIYLDKGELENVQILMEEYDRRFNRNTDQNTNIKISDVKCCPRDKEPLREIRYESEVVDICPKCKGVWCDGDELGCIIESREKSFSSGDLPEVVATEKIASPSKAKELVPSGPCVFCNELMQKVNYGYSSGIVIERCKRKHGFWLDAGELEAVQVFAERWEKEENRITQKYSGALNSAKAEVEARYEKMLQERKVSRFSSVNRFFRWLGRS